MLSKDGNHYEKQWDCLQRINTRLSCADPSIIYFNFGE